jgi:hypothetical protein
MVRVDEVREDAATPLAGAGAIRAMPAPLHPDVTSLRDRATALDHLSRVFAIRPRERVLLLVDPLLDPRVVRVIEGIAAARGATVRVVQESTSQVTEIPDAVKPLLAEADFVVSTWFCSVISPFCIGLRRRGQRWVKITYFRDLDLLDTPQGRFPPELVGELIRATADRFPRERPFELTFSCPRGTAFRVGYTVDMARALLAGNRWRGRMLADEPGCYVHYLPTHGPNLWDRTAHDNDADAPVAMSGVVVAEGAVGFPSPFPARVACHFEGDTVSAVEVASDAPWARALRADLPGARLIELGCGFNPKAPREVVYPAGSNAPGALHFGVDLRAPSDWLRRALPRWEEPPVHIDLVVHDATVRIDGVPLVQDGRLVALNDALVVAAASAYGDPVDVLALVGDSAGARLR